VEDVGAVLVDEHAVLVVVVVSIPGDVVASIDDEHALAAPGGELLGQYRAREAGADDQGVVAVAHGGRA
jgi:hypothetical protein